MRLLYFFIICVFAFTCVSCSKTNQDKTDPPVQVVPEVPETDTTLGEMIVDNNNTIRKYTYYYDDKKRLIRWNDSINISGQQNPKWEWINSHIFSYNNDGLIREMKIIWPTSPDNTYTMTYFNNNSFLIWKPDPASSIISHHFKLNNRLQILSDTPYSNNIPLAEYTNNIYDSQTGNLKERHRLSMSNDTLASYYFTYDNKKNPFKSLNQADLYFEFGQIAQNNLLESIIKINNVTSVFRKWTYTYNNLNFPKQAVPDFNNTTTYTFDFIK